MISGGVNINTIPEYLKHGAYALSTGVTVIDKSMLEKDDYESIKAMTTAHIDAIKNA